MISPGLSKIRALLGRLAANLFYCFTHAAQSACLLHSCIPTLFKTLTLLHK